MLRFLVRARLPAHRRRCAAGTRYDGRLIDATLGILQQFLAGATDGWELALDELAQRPRGVPRPRCARSARSPARCTPCSAPTPTTRRSRPRSRAARRSRCSPRRRRADRARVPRPARRRGDRADRRPRRGRARAAAALSPRRRRRARDPPPRRLPPRPDHARRRRLGRSSTSRASRRGRCPSAACKRSPLRDVAGMLRSFAYAATASRLLRGTPPEGWEQRARERFLDGYFEAVDRDLLPPAATRPSAAAVFELEKAVYELRYELDNRPDWVAIPVAGIVRLLESEQEASAMRDEDRLVVARSTRTRTLPRRAPRRTAAVVVRAFRPAAGAVTRAADGGDAVELEQVHPAGVFEGRARRRDAAARATGSTSPTATAGTSRSTTRTASCRRSASSTSTSLGEGRHERAVRAARRARARDRRRARARRSRSGRRPRAPSASSATSTPGTAACTRCARSARPASGSCSCRASATARLQVRDPRARTASCALKADPYAFADRDAAEDRLGRATTRARLGRRRVAGASAATSTALGPDVDLRGAPRLVAANPLEGNRSLTYRELADELADYVQRHGLHARRAAAGDGAPVHRLLGLPGDRLLRADAALRHARRLPRLRRPRCTSTGSA